MTDQWIEVFKAGTHTDAAGNERAWTEADLDTIAASYDPEKHEAPVVIGHPADNGPAYGWVESLRRDGSTLLARLKGVVPEFSDAVKAGLYKKRSIALYPDLSLRHLGFLGAMPPAVKGLADIKFDDDGTPPIVITGDFAEHSHNGGHMAEEKDTGIAELLAQIAEKDAALAAQKALTEAEQTKAAAFAEAEKKAVAELAILKQSARKAELSAFCESLVVENKLPAGRKEDVLAVLESVSALQDGAQFAEGEKTLAVKLMDCLAGFPAFNFAEQATKRRASEQEQRTDTEAVAMEAREYQETKRRAGTDISFTAAVAHIIKGGQTHE